VARAVVCSTGYLSDIEKDRKTPGADLLFALHREYNANIHYLLAGEGPTIMGSWKYAEVKVTSAKTDCAECEKKVAELQIKLDAYREIIHDLGAGKKQAGGLIRPVKKQTQTD
jgi:transcriptional regulator with XRE-family HTH domain